MAEVLPAQIQTEGQSFYASSGLRRSRPSQPSLYIPTTTTKSSRAWKEHDSHNDDAISLSRKHRSFLSPSRLNEFANTEQLPSKPPQTRKQIEVDTSVEPLFEGYTPLPLKIDEEGNEAPPSSPLNTPFSPEGLGTTIKLLYPRGHILVSAGDDVAVKQEPSQHVDYLSHDWKEEDIWSSWRHIVSQRKVYGERSRLENASWRTWAKHKNQLKTVHPQNLNWLKDCDVTWLYGPLQTAKSYLVSDRPSEPASNLSKNNSFSSKKPILKKRSVSEMMLQKSLSNSSLVRQAAAAIQAQRRSPYESLSRRASDYMTDTISSRATSGEGTDYFSSQSTSGFQSPAPEHAERKHIRFDDKVEQCIAVEIKEGEYEEEEEAITKEEDSSSEEGLVMATKWRRRIAMPRLQRRSSTADSKTIAKLPSTTLKDRVEPPDSDPPSHSLVSNPIWRPRLSPSPSLETLRPSDPSKNFLISEDEDCDGFISEFQAGLGIHDLYHSEEEERVGGLRRTESGMFMPIEESDDEQFGGIVGRVIDTVNTARDIAHVIMNVGWRR